MNKPPELKDCPLCGGAVGRKQISVPVTVGARTVDVPGDHAVCAKCGEVFYAPGEMDEAMRRASAIVRDELGLLQSHEIRAIRESFGLTQALFEQALGVGEKTVVRWEKGTVFQNSSTDTLLRAMRDVPETATYLLHRAGIAAQPPAAFDFGWLPGGANANVPLAATLSGIMINAWTPSIAQTRQAEPSVPSEFHDEDAVAAAA